MFRSTSNHKIERTLFLDALKLQRRQLSEDRKKNEGVFRVKQILTYPKTFTKLNRLIHGISSDSETPSRGRSSTGKVIYPKDELFLNFLAWEELSVYKRHAAH